MKYFFVDPVIFQRPEFYFSSPFSFAGPSGFYILENLQPTTTYDLRFASKNLVGFSEWGAGKQLTMPQRGPPEKPRINTMVRKINQFNYVGVRIYQGIRMIKRSEMRPLGAATFWDNHLPAGTTILTPILVCPKPKILPIRWCHFL